ncbi:MAG: hypothetical protein Q4B17_07145 [Lautropia sp.]|nr:hypothetical protein [Lautropia sp.]
MGRFFFDPARSLLPMSMPTPLTIQVETVDASVWLDRLLLVLVVVLMAAAWWLETPYNVLWLALFGAVAWGVPRLLFGSRRAADAAAQRHRTMSALDGSRRRFSPASLCAQARSPVLHKPWALRVDADGSLSCRWTPDAPWAPVESLQTLQLGPLLQLRFQARMAGDPASPLTESDPSGQNAPLARGVESGAIDPITYAAPTSTGSAASALMTEASPVRQPEPALQHAACLLWMPRLPADEVAALRRWLLWRQRGGQ